MMEIDIRVIEYNSQDYKTGLVFRDEILRKPLGLYFSPEDIQDETDEHHIMAYSNDELIGTLLLKPADNSIIRMRQVAVAPNLQGKGIGRAMVEFSETFALNLGFTQMILHARDTAIPFYEKLGYIKTGSEYIEVTLPHFTMMKYLKRSGS